ncbi:hypothetical protein KNU94_gp49 [Xanthomonas phage FoX2]|uniref:dATP/dGTP diphosphohydrolase N-terminal domain-containing protein n=1 Tax=Xanthomonas phage FoX2 TaxID=2723898 RepID=A0A858NQD4_9CAUD|nr:hypothetical protein KNU94_gp49 [Xanthomonas phage FoX2]QJB21883.1 hypothetical protein XccvBFoX2_gp64 [Xanthomonas phage FoX2]
MTAPGIKSDSDKHRPTLIFRHMPNAIAAVIECGEFGAKKYDEHPMRCNWDKVEGGLQRYTDAMLRHQLAELGGEDRDSDSRLLHAAHAAWNSLARLELIIRQRRAANENTPQQMEIVDFGARPGGIPWSYT